MKPGTVRKKLMVALYYPAILGAGFFVILSRGLENFSVLLQANFWLAVAITAYFSISYLVTDAFDSKNDGEGYGTILFCLDATEALLLLAMFSSLGFAETSQHEDHMVRFYFYLLCVAGIQYLWHLVSNTQRRATGAFFSGLCIGLIGMGTHRYAYFGPYLPYVDPILAGSLGIMALFYFLRAAI